MEKVDNKSVQHFISSTIQMPEPGILVYNPSASQEKWFMTYIRHQVSQKFMFRDSCTVDVSIVGQHKIDDGDKSCQEIRLKDLVKRHEVEV